MQQLTPDQKAQLERVFQRRKKSLLVAYLLWFIIGAHHGYLGKWPTQILFWLTLWGLGIWWLIDAIRMQTLVNNTNDTLEERLTMELLKGNRI